MYVRSFDPRRLFKTYMGDKPGVWKTELDRLVL